MKKLLLPVIFTFIIVIVFGQKVKRVTGVISAQANIMAYDRLIQYIHSGAGAGLQVCYNATHKIKPLVDVTASLFSTNKILLVFADGTTTAPKDFVLTTFAGLAYSPIKNLEISISTGPSFVKGGTYAGIKPCVGYYFGKKELIKAHAALTHIFERDRVSKKNAGFISFGIALKLF